MAKETLGDCPVCGHKEQGYDDWKFLGYQFGKERIWECRTCGARVTPDPDGVVKQVA